MYPKPKKKISEEVLIAFEILKFLKYKICSYVNNTDRPTACFS